MTKAGQGKTRALKVVSGTNRDSVSKDSTLSPIRSLIGSPTPRVHSKLNDLPSKGQELIDFATKYGIELMPWQRFVMEHAHKIKEDQRWNSSEICIVGARQNGKSTLLMVRALAGLFLWNEPLQISSAHRLSTSLELFRQIVKIIETHDELKEQVKVIRWSCTRVTSVLSANFSSLSRPVWLLSRYPRKFCLLRNCPRAPQGNCNALDWRSASALVLDRLSRVSSKP